MPVLPVTIQSENSVLTLGLDTESSILSLSSIQKNGLDPITFHTGTPCFKFYYSVESGDIQTYYTVSSLTGITSYVTEGTSGVSVEVSSAGGVRVGLRFYSSGTDFYCSSFFSSTPGGGEIFKPKSFIFPKYSINPIDVDPYSLNLNDYYISPYAGGKVQFGPALGQTNIDKDLHDLTFPANEVDYALGNGQMAPIQMSFFSNINNKLSLYFQTMDVSGYAKLFSSYRNISTGGTMFLLDHRITEVETSNPYQYLMPYLFKMKTFQGDWYDAALEYRNFSESAPWKSRGKIDLADSTKFSKKLLDISTVFHQATRLAIDESYHNSNLSRMYLDAFITKDKLGIPFSNVAIVNFGWNTSSFDTWLPFMKEQNDYPEYVSLISNQGGVIIPYQNNICLDLDASNTPIGSILINYINRKKDQSPLDVMPFSNLVYLNPRHTALDDIIYGVNNSGGVLSSTTAGGALFDVAVGVGSIVDYSNTLLSVDGGIGNTGKDVSATKRFINRARSKYSSENSDFIIMSEGLSENFIDVVDVVSRPHAFLSLGGDAITYANANGETPRFRGLIPLWESIYHEYMMVMDRISPITPEVFKYAISGIHDWVSGSDALNPSVSNKENYGIFLSHQLHQGRPLNFGLNYVGLGNDPEDPVDAPYGLMTDGGYPGQEHYKFWEFAKTILKMYPHYKKYSLFGRRMRPLDPIAEMSEYMTKTVPLATSVWKASDGTLGILLTNASAVASTKNVVMSHSSYELGNYNRIVEILPDGTTKGDSLISGGIDFSVQVPAWGIRLFKIYSFTPEAAAIAPTSIEETLSITTGEEEDLLVAAKRRSPEQWVRDHYLEFSKNKTHISFIYRDILKTLMDTVQGISYINAENNEVKIQKVFSNQERAIAELNKGDTTVLPIIAIERKISNTDKDRRRTKLSLQYYTYKSKKAKRAYRLISPSPTAVNIEYILNIWSNYQSDMDQIIEQIRSTFNPSVQIKNDGKTVDFPCFISEESDESDLNVRNTEDREIKRSVKISVEGYIPPPVYLITSTGRIEVINSEVDLDSLDI